MSSVRLATADDLSKVSPYRRKVLSLIEGRWVSINELQQKTGTTHVARRISELKKCGLKIASKTEGGVRFYAWGGFVND